jgi:hypothetical protein
VSLTPERPFIPAPVASTRRPAGAETQFRLMPPYVHGREMQHATATATTDADLPPIENFLESDFVPEGAAFVETESEGVPYAESGFDFSQTTSAEPADLPPIEHFTDPLPSVDTLAPSAEPETLIADYESVEAEAEWVDTGWQDFDWNATAALGEASHPEASDEWSRTDWGNAGPARDNRETPAQAIASALDQIAQRIRDGDLIVPPADLVADPAAIAATLAALLGVRR